MRDWHILTNGLVRFTTDDRFDVLYTEGSYDWILQVTIIIVVLKKCSHDRCITMIIVFWPENQKEMEIVLRASFAD